MKNIIIKFFTGAISVLLLTGIIFYFKESPINWAIYAIASISAMELVYVGLLYFQKYKKKNVNYKITKLNSFFIALLLNPLVFVSYKITEFLAISGIPWKWLMSTIKNGLAIALVVAVAIGGIAMFFDINKNIAESILKEKK
ncbi:hypothetical protein KY342_00970 [Candidatus Woesearchaeota archaeon]|nr:hypothetical protein [Candidatus Woesearchaeota archaeon]